MSDAQEMKAPAELTELPFDEGADAYRHKQHHSKNPYQESDWKHEEWWKGWNDQAECDSDDAFNWNTDSFRY